jgi:mannose-binding lectin 1
MQNRQDQKQSNDHQQNQQQQQQQQKSETKLSDIPQMLSDVLAGNIRSQQDQFEDLHNRIQIINHRVDEIYNMVQGIQATNDHRFQQLMDRIVPMDDRGSATLRNMEKVERSTMDILRNVESKDFKDMLTAVHNAVQNSHDSLTQGLPLAVAQSKFRCS